MLKEPDYVMQLMSTYGTNERVGELKKRVHKAGGEHRERLSSILKLYTTTSATDILLLMTMANGISRSAWRLCGPPSGGLTVSLPSFLPSQR
jgi:hypothetical protein